MQLNSFFHCCPVRFITLLNLISLCSAQKLLNPSPPRLGGLEHFNKFHIHIVLCYIFCVRVFFVFTLIFVLLKGVVTYAEISPNIKCPDIDNSAHFGPIRDQDGYGECWAFVGAALWEEYYCSVNKTLCGKSVSVIDASRNNWSYGVKWGGGFIGQAIALQEGVCFEEYAPFKRNFAWKCVRDYFNRKPSGKNSKCVNDQIIEIFNREKSNLLRLQIAHNIYPRCGAYSPQEEAVIKRLENDTRSALSKILGYLPDADLNNIDLKKAFSESLTAYEFLFKIFITPECEKFRVPPSGRVYFKALDGEKYNIDQKFSAVTEVLKSGRSIGVHLCLEKLSTPPKLSCKMSHGLIINGVRYNKTTDRCEIHLKNSWGKGAPHNGWADAEKYMNATKAFFTMELSKK